jgi:putative ABC transport system permease protein
MNIGQAVIEAIQSLTTNKLRSSLTILGIVIGVAAVIAMLAVGNGAQNAITSSISGIGTNLLFVFGRNMEQDVRNPKPLTLGDVDAFRDQLLAPSVADAAPVIETNAEVSFQGELKRTTVDGVTASYLKIRNYSFIEGEAISDLHQLERASVALVGVEVADKLFGAREGLIGATIRIDGHPFRVIGVLAPKGGGSFGSQDDVVLVPFTTAQTRLANRGSDRVDIAFVSATRPETVRSASEEIAQILRTRHRTEIGVDDFTIFTQEDFISTASSITSVLTIFLGGIAAISLLVGGIGIMNIMLVSVTERTREIGLRKALGARRRDILIQFLTESSMLSMVGGIIGIGLGWLIAFVVGKVAAANNTQLVPAVGLDAILLATLFSTAVGLFFGIYPANRAANLAPVEALRYE